MQTAESDPVYSCTGCHGELPRSKLTGGVLCVCGGRFFAKAASEQSSLWLNPRYPPPAMRLLPVRDWGFFELAGQLLKSCVAKYSLEQQRKVGEFVKTVATIAEQQVESRAGEWLRFPGNAFWPLDAFSEGDSAWIDYRGTVQDRPYTWFGLAGGERGGWYCAGCDDPIVEGVTRIIPLTVPKSSVLGART